VNSDAGASVPPNEDASVGADSDAGLPLDAGDAGLPDADVPSGPDGGAD
jgi:hypothetical protein